MVSRPYRNGAKISRTVVAALAELTSKSSREKRDTARCGASIAVWTPLHCI